MEHTKYSGLIAFIRYIENEMTVHICIKDYVSFIPLDKELDRLLLENLIHANPYCMYMKYDEPTYIRCTGTADGVLRHFQNSSEAFCGICHAGVKEYVCPIWHDDQLIGTVNAGSFAIDKALAKRFIVRACRGKHLDSAEAIKLYENYIPAHSVDENRLYTYLNVIASMFSVIFERLSTYSEFSSIRTPTALSHDSIINEALEYMKQNLRNDVKIKDVAAYCHCSVSCLSHIFKRRVGMSVPVYITNLRLEDACDELCRSDISIAAIAASAGFSDPNYFTRLFTQYKGFTPSQYRKRFNKQ